MFYSFTIKYTEIFCWKIERSFLIFFRKNYWHIWDINVWNFNETLTNDIVSFEQPGPSLQAHDMKNKQFIPELQQNSHRFTTHPYSYPDLHLRWIYFSELPSNSRLGSFSSRVRSSLADFRIFARAYFTRQTSRLFLKPYSPISFSSWSRRSFSKGRLGVVKVLCWTSLILMMIC